MTKRGSFKRAVRRQARGSGKRYTETLAEIKKDHEVAARIDAATQWHGQDGLPAHLEDRYGISVSSIFQLSPHGAGVFRVHRHDGLTWVARIFPTDSRPIDRLQGDVDILRFLEKHEFPAERCAHAEPLSTYEGQSIFVTEFVAGETPGQPNAEHEHALADLLGCLHALPEGEGAVARDGGAFVHDPLREGKPREDLAAALTFLATVEDDVPAAQRGPLESLREQIAAADGCDDLPEALTNPDMVDRNVIVTPDGTRVAVDWKGAGRGPRLPALAFLLHGTALQDHPASAATSPGGDPSLIDAIVSGYGAHIRLEPEELSRLAGAMRVRPLYFACWYYWRAVSSGIIPNGTEGWWPDTDSTDAIAEQAVAAFRQS